MANGRTFVPPHLRRFVVEQDYDQYNEIDQAVWRFVLLQMRTRLAQSAHPIYQQGFTATGMTVDRIPRIDEMNDGLSRFGWGAVCVDGFIPPRAFQEFQAHGILPIAADIRTRQHLPYTPAPDIIHEAAGHAPILPDPSYARYLRRIGQLGAQAFTLPADDQVFRAVRALSEIKEDPAARDEDVGRTEAHLQEAVAASAEVSEAARLSRLYWWTAEYGLVGRPDDYRIYGAGLLSSLGESHSCHQPAVRKLVLDASCVDVAYDITRPQPQLYVTPSFAALHDVLEDVARGLRRGGTPALLDRALRSQELASVQVSPRSWVMGTLVEVEPSPDAPAWLAFDGPVGYAWELAESESVTGNRGGIRVPATAGRQWIPIGPLCAGRALEDSTDAEIDASIARDSGRHEFVFQRGARVAGNVRRRWRAHDGRLVALDLDDVGLTMPGQPTRLMVSYTLFAARDVLTARAGAIEPSFQGETDYPSTRVPTPRTFTAGEQRLLDLYGRAHQAMLGGQAVDFEPVFAAVHRELRQSYPDEWLMRWNLLESLGRAGGSEILRRALQSELEQLEVTFAHQQPIASGLRYLLTR